MTALFQLTVFALILLSFALVVGIPFTFALPQGWVSNRNFIFAGSGVWLLLVFAVGILNSFVV
uniref:Photosystem II reaction center protein Z n=1 Tax=Chloropicon maureeniae TaxID=1461542 RepID=A0A4D6C3B1_9CHLO|nr:Z protein of photosystem II [Chloropicon maureeniae]QBX98201.1 Z protein of photosystem II [Chloropicon maureeniae]